MARKVSARLLRFAMNLWPPYLFTGVRIAHISADFRSLRVELPLRWFNRNYFGTHFGGLMYAMTDPFYALMVLHNLPDDYVVWDKAASIDFVAPGRSRLSASFRLTEADIEHIRKMTAHGDKHLHLFHVDVLDDEGLVVARVEKVVYARRKRPATSPALRPATLAPLADATPQASLRNPHAAE
jgi:acyl-coenzyme A thioesterase PaaI-like protein